MEKIGNLWFLKGDMHIHSHYSDGERLEKNIARVVNCGFDFCAVTDHDSFSGSRAALDLSERIGSGFPIIIRGQESTCSGCHILSYGTLNDYVKSSPLEEVCRNIRAAGGYSVAAHPDWEFTRSYFRESGLFARLVENGLLDGVELMNFPAGENIRKEWTNSYYFERSAAGLPFAVTCGSDAHRANEITPERYLAVFAETPDEKGILEAIFLHRRSAAVWRDCVIGTPEACKLFSAVSKKRRIEAPSITRSETQDGIIFNIENADRSFVSGDLKKISENSFFKSGFDHGVALLMSTRDGEKFAEYIEIPNRVDVRCIPEDDGNRAAAHFTLNSEEELSVTCEVNGVCRKFGCIPGEAGLTSGVLQERDNSISVEVTNKNGVVMCRKSWDFPISYLDTWYPLERYTVDSPSPDGVEPSAKFRFSRSGENVILDMEVTDPLFCQPCRGIGMYMGDSVQFGLDFACAASENDLVERKIWEFGISVTDTFECDFVVYNFPADADKSSADKIKRSAVRRGDKSIFQAVIPVEFFNEDMICGFNMIYNINDGSGRRGYLAWRNGIGDRKKSADWGFILLKQPK